MILLDNVSKLNHPTKYNTHLFKGVILKGKAVAPLELARGRIQMKFVEFITQTIKKSAPSAVYKSLYYVLIFRNYQIVRLVSFLNFPHRDLYV